LLLRRIPMQTPLRTRSNHAARPPPKRRRRVPRERFPRSPSTSVPMPAILSQRRHTFHNPNP
jgi:hypothetical protein